MTLEERNLAVERELFVLCGAGDWEKVQDLLTEDFFVSEASDLPYAGVYRGRGAMRQIYETVMGMMPVEGLDLIEMTAGGDWVIVLVEMRVRDADGEFRIPLAEATRFRDGRIAEIKPYYFDHALVHRAIAARRAAA